MPTVTIDPPPTSLSSTTSPLPPLLQTPAGLAIIEIQGTLNISQPSSDDIQSIGRVVFANLPAGTKPDANNTKWMKKVHLYVGKNQKLVGEVRKLAKPLAVIRRKESGEAEQDAPSSQDELEIMDIVRYKLFFGGRPEFV